MPAERNAPMLLGITGGMGSGKSRVSRFWARFSGLPRIDIDAVCRGLLQPGAPGWHALRGLLSARFFSTGGEVDRKRLRAALFADEELRQQINSRIHPLARQQMNFLADQEKAPMVLVDVPLLYEAGWEESFARCVVVFADRETCCKRLATRDHLSQAEAGRSISAQLPLPEKAMLAHHVIDNSGCWLYTRLQIVHLAALPDFCRRESEFAQESP